MVSLPMQMIYFSCVSLLLTYFREDSDKNKQFLPREVPPHSVVMYYVFRLTTTSVSRIFDGILEGGQLLKRYEQCKKSVVL